MLEEEYQNQSRISWPRHRLLMKPSSSFHEALMIFRPFHQTRKTLTTQGRRKDASIILYHTMLTVANPNGYLLATALSTLSSIDFTYCCSVMMTLPVAVDMKNALLLLRLLPYYIRQEETYDVFHKAYFSAFLDRAIDITSAILLYHQCYCCSIILY